MVFNGCSSYALACISHYSQPCLPHHESCAALIPACNAPFLLLSTFNWLAV